MERVWAPFLSPSTQPDDAFDGALPPLDEDGTNGFVLDSTSTEPPCKDAASAGQLVDDAASGDLPEEEEVEDSALLSSEVCIFF